MEVLGTLLDEAGTSSCSIEHRLRKGETCYWMHSQTYRGAGSIATKLRSWTSGPAASAIYGCCTWHVTRDLLISIKRWEFGMLRRMLRCRRQNKNIGQVGHVRQPVSVGVGSRKPKVSKYCRLHVHTCMQVSFAKFC